MKKRIFLVTVIAIFLVSFFFHIFAIKNNNFFFTVDQGRDAIYVREILNYHKIFLRGPETTIRGIFTGPLWYYFIAVGFSIFGEDPIGGVVIMILLNIAATGFLIWWLKDEIGGGKALLIGFLLQFFWPFFSSSLWAFNPFPLVFLSILELFFLIKFLQGNDKYFISAIIPIFLAFNTELAGATVLVILWILTALWKIKKKSSLPFAVGLGVFAGTNFQMISQKFLGMVANIAFPQNLTIGILIFGFTTIIFLKRKKKNDFIKIFIYLTFVLTTISFLFFGSNRGWRDWQTVYLPPLLFISLVLMLFNIPKKISILLLSLVVISQFFNFKQNYIDYLKPSSNPSLFSNQLKVVDWIYAQSEGNGFSVYTYTNTFYDYPYQYIFGWYGKAKYGFYPCEYSNFPNSLKSLYVPGWEHYIEPKLGCDKWRYLIIESDTNGEKNKDWIKEYSIETKLIATIYIGKTKIEKRAVRTD